jgi:hypothetical protein
MVRPRIVLIAAFVFASAALAVAGVTDNSIRTPPNYYSFVPPAAGSSYVDPVFGTTVQRMTAALAMPDNASGGNLTWVLPEYNAVTPFSSTNTWLILQNDSYFGLYDGRGHYVRDLPFEINAVAEPRWARRNANLLYYKHGNQLKSYDVATGAMNVVHTFSEYGAIQGNGGGGAGVCGAHCGSGKSDISFDGDHFAFVGDYRYIFVYTISTDQKGPVFDTGGAGFDSVYISADNQVVIPWFQNGSGRYQGMELFDSNMNYLRHLAGADGHMAMSRDLNGDAVIVWTNANDPTAICQNGIVKIRLADASQTCLAGLQLDWSLAVHIGASDQGWAVVSTYAPADPSPSTSWPPYTNEVFRVKLDGSVVERLAHHRSRPFNDYNYEAWATYSRDGSRLVYGSNYGLQGILGYPTEYSDAYLINVGGNPLPPPPTAPPTNPPPTATPTPTPTPTPPPTGTPVPGRKDITDLNGGGQTDLIWQYQDGSVGAWFMNGTTRTGATYINRQTLPNWFVRGAGDFNGDGKTDLVLQHQDGRVGVWIMNGTAMSEGWYVYWQPLPGWTVRGAADFNGDGWPDILLQDAQGRAGLWNMKGLTITSGQYLNNQPLPGWTIVGTGDFNGDGKPDILWQYQDGSVGVWLMNGTEVMSTQWIHQGALPGWTIVGTGDFNGDGKTDILWQDSAGRVALWFMDGTSMRASQYIYDQPLPGWSVVASK